MRSRVLRSTPWLVAFSVACGLAACSDDGDDDQATSDAPPTLKVLGYRTSDGEKSPKDGEIELPCDRQLGVVVGPQSTPGRLDNWVLRPPGACGTRNACGYVAARIESTSTEEAVETRAATTTVPLDLSALDESGEYRVQLELRQGQTGQPFLVKGEPVSVETTLDLTFAECSPGAGGAGGTGGTGGSGGGQNGMAGLGGLGGQGGAR